MRPVEGPKLGIGGFCSFFLTLIFWPSGFFCVSSSNSGSQKIGGVLWVGKKILKKWFFEIRSNFFSKWKTKVDFFGGRKNWKNRFSTKFRKWPGGRRKWSWGSENGLEDVQTRFFCQNGFEDSFGKKCWISIFFRFSSQNIKSLPLPPVLEAPARRWPERFVWGAFLAQQRPFFQRWLFVFNLSCKLNNFRSPLDPISYYWYKRNQVK